MAYPSELIPQPEYRLISTADVMDRCLLRASKLPAKEVWDPILDCPVSEEAVEEFAKNVKDHSTALLGNYTPKHTRCRPTVADKDRRMYLFFEPWPAGEVIEHPIQESEYEWSATGSYFHYVVPEVHQHPFNFEVDGVKHNATLIVKHTPCRINYWHFSIRVLDGEGDDIGSYYQAKRNLKIKGWRKQALEFARTELYNLAQRSAPLCGPIPKDLYIAA